MTTQPFRELTLAERVWPALAAKKYFRWLFPVIEDDTEAEVRPLANRIRVWAKLWMPSMVSTIRTTVALVSNLCIFLFLLLLYFSYLMIGWEQPNISESSMPGLTVLIIRWLLLRRNVLPKCLSL